MDTKELLAERGKTHGDYSDHAQITQLLKGAMRTLARTGLRSCRSKSKRWR
jgi:hypothetical protein